MFHLEWDFSEYNQETSRFNLNLNLKQPVQELFALRKFLKKFTTSDEYHPDPNNTIKIIIKVEMTMFYGQREVYYPDLPWLANFMAQI